jgi:hypothetical protein
MDGFITLIILIIVFNLLSAVMRALKGGGAAAGRQKPGQEIAPVRRSEKIFNTIEPGDLKDLVYDYDQYKTAGEDGAADEVTGNLYEPVIKTKVAEEQEKEWVALPEPAGKRSKMPDQIKRPAPVIGIKRVLTEKDSFLAAFVLHEILDLPPALRRRGRP